MPNGAFCFQDIDKEWKKEGGKGKKLNKTHYVPYSHEVLNPTVYAPISVSVNAMLLQPPENFRRKSFYRLQPFITLDIHFHSKFHYVL